MVREAKAQGLGPTAIAKALGIGRTSPSPSVKFIPRISFGKLGRLIL